MFWFGVERLSLCSLWSWFIVFVLDTWFQSLSFLSWILGFSLKTRWHRDKPTLRRDGIKTSRHRDKMAPCRYSNPRSYPNHSPNYSPNALSPTPTRNQESSKLRLRTPHYHPPLAPTAHRFVFSLSLESYSVSLFSSLGVIGVIVSLGGWSS